MFLLEDLIILEPPVETVLDKPFCDLSEMAGKTDRSVRLDVTSGLSCLWDRNNDGVSPAVGCGVGGPGFVDYSELGLKTFSAEGFQHFRRNTIRPFSFSSGEVAEHFAEFFAREIGAHAVVGVVAVTTRESLGTVDFNFDGSIQPRVSWQFAHVGVFLNERISFLLVRNQSTSLVVTGDVERGVRRRFGSSAVNALDDVPNFRWVGAVGQLSAHEFVTLVFFSFLRDFSGIPGGFDPDFIEVFVGLRLFSGIFPGFYGSVDVVVPPGQRVLSGSPWDVLSGGFQDNVVEVFWLSLPRCRQ